MKKLFFFSVLVLSWIHAQSQTDTVWLETANLSDTYFLKFSDSQSKKILNDSILSRNPIALTGLLNFNSTIYFKENGAGMVSSPSFRGTTASQTAVVWNGININSQMNGQADFNTINSLAFDQIAIKAGGGSAGYGSGAIGGSILLNNELYFNRGLENQATFRYGSFNSYAGFIKSSYSNANTSIQISGGRSGSDNDYKFLNSNRKNKNGAYYNNLFSVAAAYQINNNHRLKFYGNLFDGERHFALITDNSTATKYHDYHTRTLLEWDGKFNRVQSNLKLAHLNEKFRYYPNLNSIAYEYGDSDTYLAKYSLSFRYNKLYFSTITDYEYAETHGTSIQFAKKQNLSLGFLYKHQLTPKFLYEASLRGEFNSVYKSPLLYSLGAKWQATSFYQLSFNASKNFRTPTFNDLFWPGSGNLDLKPETSIQAEINHLLHGKAWHFQLTAYYNQIENLIQWVPTASVHVPENVGKVNAYGAEANFNYNQNWGHHHFDFQTSYAYTVSENDQTKKQLIYVPFHKATASLAHSFKNWTTYYQWMYLGKIYTDTKNQNELKDYTVSNIGADYGLGKKAQYKIGFQVLNLWNEDYQTTLNRPMPGRNYNLYIQLKF